MDNFTLTATSPSGRYKVYTGPDPSGEKSISTISRLRDGVMVTEQVHCDKYKIVRIVRTADENTVYQYKRFYSRQPFTGFLTIKGCEWWFSGRHYLFKMFVNCDTGVIYDEGAPEVGSPDDTPKVPSNSWEFIWTGGADVSEDGNTLFMTGCVWACPYERREYDISALPNIKLIRCLSDESDDDGELDEH